MMTDNGVILFF